MNTATPPIAENPARVSLMREPLLHFLGIAALLFAANAFFAADERSLIVVSPETQEFLVSQQTELLMRPLNDDERDRVINDFVDEEILAAEARKQGFDNSSRIRALLIENMRYFLTSDLPLPETQELRRFFDKNPQRFETQPTASYDVLRLRAEASPVNAVAELNDGAEPAAVFGAGAAGDSRLLKIDGRTLAAMFGPEVTREIIAIDDELWHGPFRTAQGQHFLRVTERQPAHTPPFELIEGWVEAEWTRDQHLRVMEQNLQQMRLNYRIEIADAAPGSAANRADPE